MAAPVSIHQRRYIGSKTKLLSFIDDILTEEKAAYSSVADIFAGTGVVGHHFNERAAIVLNDILESNYLAHQAFLGSQPLTKQRLTERLAYYNTLNPQELPENYVSKQFRNTYFSHDNCKLIGFIREDIETFTAAHKLNERERAYLITSLLYAMDRIANTVGHYDAYRRAGDLGRQLELRPLTVSVHNQNNQIFRQDANELVRALDSEVVYIDPPYNSRQYSDTYHLLENIASWRKPRVSGVAKKMDRSHLKSKYSLKSAGMAFSDLIENIKPSTKYILVSYNNMGKTGNQRSHSRISDQELIAALERRGSVKVYEKEFKQFTTGKSRNDDLKERIFFCRVDPRLQHRAVKSLPKPATQPVAAFIKSPLNYTGGKHKLLPQLTKYFPDRIAAFYDVFCGGANVGINAVAEKIIGVDSNKRLIKLLHYIKATDFETLDQKLMRVIETYGLSQSYLHGYAHYHSESSHGLGMHNKAAYLRLRQAYNEAPERAGKSLLLLALIFYSFNNQIRFNQQGDFNLPVGKRDYNGSSRRNLAHFSEAATAKAVEFRQGDFRSLPGFSFAPDDFVYLDPPYLLGLASYNESGGWTEKDEHDLYAILTDLSGQGVRFALSNVIEHKGERNHILERWAHQQHFTINELDFHYANSNYHSRAKHATTREVLITNYAC